MGYFKSVEYCQNLTSSLAEFEKEQIPDQLKAELLKERLENCGIEPCAWWLADIKYKHKCVVLSHYIEDGIFKFTKYDSHIEKEEQICKYSKLKPICHKKLL